jgi:hypothetical protein
MRGKVLFGVAVLVMALATGAWAANSIFVLSSGFSKTVQVDPAKNLYISLQGENAQNSFSYRLSLKGKTTFQKSGNVAKGDSFRKTFAPGTADKCDFSITGGKIRVMVIWR